MTRYTGLIDQYRSRLPFAPAVRAISLCEGRTPLIKLENIPKDIGFGGEIYVKFEGLNPTGSFKDRGMTAAVTQAVHEGSKAIICASTGNTSAAAAAYASRAGITAFVLIPEGKIALGKLAQAVVHGAVVVQIQGNFDDGMRLVKELGATTPVSIVNSINPYRLQGQKTAAFEIVEALGRAPDVHALPVGNAGNISAYWMGYSEASGQRTSASMEGYEIGGLSVQGIYNYRSHYYQAFVSGNAQLRYVSPVGTFDLRASYDVNRNLRLEFQALNLLNENRIDYMPVYGSVRQYYYYGSKFFIGARIRF